MQRSIPLVAFVLLALCALVIGVLQLLSGPPASLDTPGDPAPLARAEPPKPATPVEIAPSGETRTTARASSSASAGEIAVASYQYANRLLGQVVDREQKPVAGAEVLVTTFGTDALFFVNVEADRSHDARTRTGADGRFAVASLAPRTKYRIAVTHPDFARKEVDSVPIYPEGDAEEPVIVLDGGARLVGRVSDAKGPVANAMLELSSRVYDVSPYPPPDALSATSRDDGTYEIAHVAAGQRTLKVRAPGHGTVTITGLDFDVDGTVTRDVTLVSGLSITGRVVGPRGVGLAGASVVAVGVSVQKHTGLARATSDAKGDFAIEALVPGTYNVVAKASGWRFEHSQRIEAGTTDVRIEAFKDATVCGRVVDAETGAPIPAFTVRLRGTFEGTEITQPIPESKLSVEGPTADREPGVFCFASVQSSGDGGGYVVEARAPGYATGISPAFAPQTGQDVNEVVVRLGRGGKLHGRVVDPDGKPVANALVESHANDWAMDAFQAAIGEDDPTLATSISTRTDANGRFELALLRPELYQIVIEAAGFCALEQKDVAVADAQDADVGDVRLARGGGARGRVLGPDGKPFAGAVITVTILEGDRPREYRAKSSTDGSWSVRNLVPGRYRVYATPPREDRTLLPGSPALPQAPREIAVTEGAELADVDVTLAP